jgi:hypothetical protein
MLTAQSRKQPQSVFDPHRPDLVPYLEGHPASPVSPPHPSLPHLHSRAHARGLPAGYLAQHPLFDQIPALRRDIAEPDYCCLRDEGLSDVEETEVGFGRGWDGGRGRGREGKGAGRGWGRAWAEAAMWVVRAEAAEWWHVSRRE